MTLRGELILLILVSLMLLTTIILVNNYVVTIILTTLIFCKYTYFVLFVRPVTKEEYEELRGRLVNA